MELKRSLRFAILDAPARYPSGKGEVCKTFIRGFDSHPRLQSIAVKHHELILLLFSPPRNKKPRGRFPCL